MSQSNQSSSHRFEARHASAAAAKVEPSNVRSASRRSLKPWVLITGASGGFGEEFARQYAERGHPVVLVPPAHKGLGPAAGTSPGRRGFRAIVSIQTK